MSTATAPATAPASISDRPLFEYIAQANCLSCDGAIPRELIFRNNDRTDPALRVVKAWCQHCKRAYVVKQRLRGGHWEDVGPVEVLTAGKEFAGVKARAEHALGLMHNA